MGKPSTKKSGHASSQSEDFWLHCMYSEDDESTINSAVSALFYLPENFKLLVTGDFKDDPISITDHIDFKGRIKVVQESDAPSFGLSLFDEQSQHPVESSPSIVVSKSSPEKLSKDDAIHYKVVTDSPEALASAALSIFRSV